MKKKAIVLGAGGFIGHHLAKSLVNEGFWVWSRSKETPLKKLIAKIFW